MLNLRDYQQQAIADVEQALQQHSRVILGMPTGAGKTVTAAAMIHSHAQQDRKSLFIVDRRELAAQAARHLEQLGLQVGILQADNTRMLPDDEVIVCSIQTIRSREAPLADFVVLDEVNILHREHIRLLEAWPEVNFVGLSATPLRQDLGKYFQALVRGPTVAELTGLGYLAPVRAFCPSSESMRELLNAVKTTAGDFSESELSKAINQKELVGDIVKTWQEKAGDRQTLCFSVDIAHSKAIEADFKAAGVRVEHIDAYTPEDDREQIIQGFRDRRIQILTSVNVLGIGFDVPDASCAILARPTLSEALSMQQVGRVLRPADGKQDALLLDHAGNTLRFGLPKDFRIPDLNDHDRPTTKEKRKQLKMLSCKECSFVLEPSQRTCPNCGTDRVKHNSNLVYRDGVLVEYDGDGDGKQHYSQADQRAWYSAFKWFAERQPQFKNPRGWTYYIFLSKFSVKPPWDWWESVESEIPDPEQTRWIKYHTIRQAKSCHKPKKAPLRKSRRCRVCNSEHVEAIPGKGPHAAGRRCGDCGKFLGWIPKNEFEATLRG